MLLRPIWASLLLIFFGTMIVIGAIPGNASALSSRFGDKLLHLLAYGCMAALCFRAVKGDRRLQSLVSLIIIALLGMIDELTQALLPYRNASLLDWCFDIAAASAVITLLYFFPPVSTRSS
jgi:VanZ family protein